MADQALISLANFFTMLVLARELSVNDFGQYVLVVTGLQLVLSFQGPLVTQPHNVLAFRHGDDNYQTYTSTCLYAQAGLAVISLLAFFAAAGVISIWDASSGQLVFVMALAALAWQLQEFFRRVMYTEERPPSAFLNDLVSFGGQIVLIGVLLVAGILNAPIAVLCIAVTSLVAASIGFIQTRSSFNGQFRSEYLRSNWRHSRWLVGAAGSSVINRHLWYYMLALFSGPAAAATLAAVTILLRPVGILVTSVETMLPTHLARRLVGGRLHGFAAYKPVLFLAPVIAAYCLFIVLAGDRILARLYSGSYQNETLLIFLLAIFYCLGFVQATLDSTMRALDKTRPLFMASVAVAALTLTVGSALTGLLSEEGAALGIVINSVVALFIVSRKVREELA